MPEFFRSAWPIGLALGAGTCLVVQAALNASLRSALASWAWAGLVSYVGGTLAMIAILAFRRESFPVGASGSWPSFIWTGGFFGALYLVLAIVLLPRLGAASLVASVIAGQMLTSLAFDHFGWLGVAQHALSPARFIGAVLLLGGVALMRF